MMRFLSISSFRKDLKKLNKQGYLSCQKDICEEFESKAEEEIRQMTIKIAETESNLLIKRRIANSGQKIGKSGGFRLFFTINRVADVVFLHIYPKKEQANPAEGIIEERLSEYESEKEILQEHEINNRLKEK